MITFDNCWSVRSEEGSRRESDIEVFSDWLIGRRHSVKLRVEKGSEIERSWLEEVRG